MPRTSLITGYLAALARELPPSVVDELADGLHETYDRFLHDGLDHDAAARAAVTEFGDPGLIAASFAAACPGRRLARHLLAAGPAVGLCWAAALVSSRAWAWPVLPAVPIAAGAALLTCVAMLAAAAFGRSYRAITRAAATACTTITVLDLALIGITVRLAAWPSWELAMAIAASGLRIGYSMRALPRLAVH